MREPLPITEEDKLAAWNAMLIVRAPEDKQENALQSREETLLERLAIRVEGFAEEVAANAYNAGYAARESDPQVLVHRSLHAIQSGS